MDRAIVILDRGKPRLNTNNLYIEKNVVLTSVGLLERKSALELGLRIIDCGRK